MKKSSSIIATIFPNILSIRLIKLMRFKVLNLHYLCSNTMLLIMAMSY